MLLSILENHPLTGHPSAGDTFGSLGERCEHAPAVLLCLAAAINTAEAVESRSEHRTARKEQVQGGIWVLSPRLCTIQSSQPSLITCCGHLSCPHCHAPSLFPSGGKGRRKISSMCTWHLGVLCRAAQEEATLGPCLLMHPHKGTKRRSLEKPKFWLFLKSCVSDFTASKSFSQHVFRIKRAK